MTTLIEFPEQVTFASQVASNVRAEVARRGLRQVDLAQALGINQSGISGRWRGRIEWSLSELEVVARLLGTTTSVLCAIRDSNPEPAGLEPRTILRRFLSLFRRRPAPADVAALAPVVDLATRRAERAA